MGKVTSKNRITIMHTVRLPYHELERYGII